MIIWYYDKLADEQTFHTSGIELALTCSTYTAERESRTDFTVCSSHCSVHTLMESVSNTHLLWLGLNMNNP